MQRLTYVYPGERVEDAKDIEEPQDHGDHDDAIEDRFYGALHGDEAIHKPEQDAHDDQRDHDIDKRHRFLIPSRRLHTNSAVQAGSASLWARITTLRRPRRWCERCGRWSRGMPEWTAERERGRRGWRGKNG